MELYELTGKRLEYGWLTHLEPSPHVSLGGDKYVPPLKIPLCPPYSKYDFYYGFSDGLDFWLKSARIKYNGDNHKFLLYPEDFAEGRMVAVIWNYLPEEEYVRATINVREGLLLHQQIHNSTNGLGTVALLICTENTILEGRQHQSFAYSQKKPPKIENFTIAFGYDGVPDSEPIRLKALPHLEYTYKEDTNRKRIKIGLF
ncbi:MAG: hypothetical protein KIH08_13005 [Candidatus Freyarchaeota archaeon]|nr:hypothetical protein [Candidatus Jordarchaeia archaeon]MBS7270469.1 hypothetical protein [Candidatus Jordarchaeia archaeon]MBS7279069.1 hypothetical protein [Candidatus Jordarchaeia archaeon]